MEMRIVLGRVLERAALRPADPEREKVQFRAITLSPRNGTRVVQQGPPATAGARAFLAFCLPLCSTVCLSGPPAPARALFPLAIVIP